MATIEQLTKKAQGIKDKNSAAYKAARVALDNARRAQKGAAPASPGGKAVSSLPKDVQNMTVASNPNTITPFGGSSYDPATNTYKQDLSAPEAAKYDAGNALNAMGTDLAKKNLGGYQKFDSSQYQGGPAFQTDTSGMGNFGGGAGATDKSNAMIGGFQQFQFGSDDASRQRIEDQVFSRLNRDTEQNRGRDLEAAKQDLFNRGIPYSDDPNSQFQKQIGDTQRRYDDITAQNRQQATQMGGQEMQNAYNIAQGTNQTQMGNINSMYGVGQQAYGTNLGANESRNAANLAEHQQGQSDLQAGYNRDLAAHQQGMQDTAQLGGQTGIGMQVPNLPGFQGPNYNPQQQAQFNQQMALNKRIADANIANSRRSGGGGSSSGAQPDYLGAFSGG